MKLCVGVENSVAIRRHGAEVDSSANILVDLPTCPANYIGTHDCQDASIQSSPADCERFYEEYNQKSFSCKWENEQCVKGEECKVVLPVNNIPAGATVAAAPATNAVAADTGGYIPNPSPKGIIAMTDWTNHRIYKCTISSGACEQVMKGWTDDPNNMNGFNYPIGVTVDFEGNYLVNDGRAPNKRLMQCPPTGFPCKRIGHGAMFENCQAVQMWSKTKIVLQQSTNQKLCNYVPGEEIQESDCQDLLGSKTSEEPKYLNPDGTASLNIGDSGWTSNKKPFNTVWMGYRPIQKDLILSTHDSSTAFWQCVDEDGDQMFEKCTRYKASIVGGSWSTGGAIDDQGNVYVLVGNCIAKFEAANLASGSKLVGSTDYGQEENTLNRPQNLVPDGQGNFLVTNRDGKNMKKCPIAGGSCSVWGSGISSSANPYGLSLG